jgi:hypothetical protein
VLRFVFITAPIFFRAALVSEERLIVSIFPLGLSLNLEAEGEDAGGWGDGWFKILGCEAETICGGRPGLFSLANDAGRGEPQLKEWFDGGEAG